MRLHHPKSKPEGDPNRPSEVLVGAEGLNEMCDKQVRGHVVILAMDVVGAGRYRLELRWPRGEKP